MDEVQPVGREPELATIREFLARGDGPPALVATGDPGIGKTTVWEAGLESAAELGYRVLLARPSEPEVQLSYVALADLLETVDAAVLAGVPAPQRRALEIALLRTDPDAAPPEPFAVSTGFTRALAVLAADRPVLVAIDDVPWLDRSSADVLAFAARRLGGRPVRFLLARRPGKSPALEAAFGAHGLVRVQIGPLSLGATRSLLMQRFGLSLPRRVLRRVFESTGGNPLFALELGRVLAERGIPDIGADLPVPDLVDDLFGERIAGLAEPVRHALLAVALAGSKTRLQLAAVVDPLAIEDAVSAGVLVADTGRVRASHPLLAASARKHSGAAERRALHLALARTAGDEALRAQHLALAAASPDAELARTVADAAGNAIARGAAHDAVELAEQALRLTPPDDPELAGRLLGLARYLVIAGEIPRAKKLLEAEVEKLPPGGARGRAYLVLAECSNTHDEWDDWADRALADSEDDSELRVTALASKATMTAAARFRQLDRAESLALEALDLAREVGPEQERWALCALAWVRLLRGCPLDDLSGVFPEAPRGSSLYENAIERVTSTQRVCHGHIHEGRALFGRMRSLAEERGEARSGLIMHFGLVDIELRAGDLLAAERLMGQVEEWAAFEDIEHDRPPRMAIFEAVRGRPAEAERWAAETISRATASGSVREQLEGQRALGLAALFLHEPRRAADALQPIWELMVREGIDEPGVWPMASDLVEALIGLGELEEAKAVTDRLERLSEEQAHPWGLASAKRCRALIGFESATLDEQAVRLSQAAADSYGMLGFRFDQARTLLILGRAQRRQKKWADARRSLEEARAVFDELGATGWAEQTETELERVGARRPSPAGTLSVTEERVARLAADGCSNKEIAAQLVVSVHTVEKHLSHAYRKLGIRSRSQLARRLSVEA